MPLCHFQSSFDVFCSLIPHPQSLWVLVSDFSPRRTVAQPVLLRALFVAASTLLAARPPSVAPYFPHPPSFHDQFPHHSAVLVGPQLVGVPMHLLDWLQPHCFIQLLTLVCGCPSVPIDHWLGSQASRPPPLVPQKRGVPLRPIECQILEFRLCFSVPFSLLQPRHDFSSERPVSSTLFCTRPPSTTSAFVSLSTLRWSFFIEVRSTA